MPLVDLPPTVMGETPDEEGVEDYVIMVSPPEAGAELADSLSRITGLDEFIARQRLLRGKPFAAAGGLSVAEAAEIQAALTQLGLATSYWSERHLTSIPDPLLVSAGELEADAVRFGTELEVPYAGVFLVVQGEITEKNLEQRREQRIVVSRYGTTRLEGRSRTSNDRGRLVVDVYHTLSAQAVRLLDGHFRGDRGHTTSRNLIVAFVKDLRERAPNEVFDSSFGSMDAVNLSTRIERDQIGSSAITRVQSDNRDEFDTYSAGLFLHVLKLRRAARQP